MLEAEMIKKITENISWVGIVDWDFWGNHERSER